jgi:glutamate-5-semialdehyde dehydrogenase
MSPSERLSGLTAGQQLVFGGDRVAVVDAELAAAFGPGDRLVIVQSTGALVHIPAGEVELVDRAVTAAVDGFQRLARCPDEAVTEFFERFASRLTDDAQFAPIATANARDVDAAARAGRSTTRLELTARMRADMVAGLRTWRDLPAARDTVERVVDHDGWSVELRRAPLGVVGFVFEGRPNVFADACGVVRSGNTVVFRIGSDALGTARAIVAHALRPALEAAGLPPGTVQLVDSPARSAGHALFDDRRLSLAVARGSGAAVTQLGAVASQAGTPVSLHGTGGAWMIAGEHASVATFGQAVEHSLDRKVCNTLNVCVIPRVRAGELVPALLGSLEAAASGSDGDSHLHVVEGSEAWIPAELFARSVASVLPESALGSEWEWERAPELSLVVTDAVADAVKLANTYSPQFVVSVITDDRTEFDTCYAALDAPFVGDGFTRWVDGQYALDLPELGLSNWQAGRLLGRGAILSGDSVHTVRYVARITDASTHR